MRRRIRYLFVLVTVAHQSASAQAARQPIIDMHLHPWAGDTTRVKLTPGVGADEAFRRAVFADMDSHNVVLAVGSGGYQYIATWRDAEPGRVLIGPMFPCVNGKVASSPSGAQCFPDGKDLPDLNWLRTEYKAGRLDVLGELTNNYAGVSPADSVMDPYFALAAELDIPVAIHSGTGPHAAIRRAGCCPNYNGDHGNPALLAPVIQRYPNLRIQLMHAGWGFPDATLALLKASPNVYVDFTGIYMYGSAAPYMLMKRLVDSGFADRIMFGSDFSLRLADHIAFIENAPFLTQQQKQDIFFNNAARFLRLRADDISRLRNVSRPR